MSDDAGWRRTASAVPFRTRWFAVRRDEITLASGEEITFHTVEHPGWTLVVPLTPQRQVVMERVYRWPHRRWMLECPAGGLDGESPETAARRELEEETGYVAGEFVHLGRFATSSGYTTERFDAWLALDARPEGQRQLESTEQIEIELIAIDELHARALDGEIEDAPTSLAIILAAARLAAR